MPRGGRSGFSGRERGAGLWDELKASFGFPAGLAMVAGLVLGFGLPTIDAWLLIEIPTFAFDTQEAATGLLETVATATVAVAGIAFSVTVVAFTLTSQQLSPRVLRSFRSDRLSQAVLALFLGTFIFCLVLLVRLGVRDNEGVPNLSITVALLLALASFGLFAMFIGHIARMLQPSTVIATIVDEAKESLDRLYPGQIGQSPDRRGPVDDEASARMERPASLTVEAESEGYLRRIEGEALIAAARRNGALVRQRVPIGDYVTPGRSLADVWADDLPDEEREELGDRVRDSFVLGQQRSLAGDMAFSIRQLADIALKGVSPGVNDPTTSENALEATAAILIRFARSERPSPVRVDSDGSPRFVATAPDLDDLIRLGFEQPRVFAATYPVLSVTLIELLGRIATAAEKAGVEQTEAQRQIALLAEGPEGEVPTDSDAAQVRRSAAEEILRHAGDAT